MNTIINDEEYRESVKKLNDKIKEAVDFLKKSDPELTPSRFVSNYVENIKALHKRAKQLHEHVGNVQKSQPIIRKQHKDLNEKLEAFKTYMEAVKAGGSQQASSKNEKKKQIKKVRSKTFGHAELIKKGVITRLDPQYEKHSKSLKYEFREMDKKNYEIIVRL
eukprot:UN34392